MACTQLFTHSLNNTISCTLTHKITHTYLCIYIYTHFHINNVSIYIQLCRHLRHTITNKQVAFFCVNYPKEL